MVQHKKNVFINQGIVQVVMDQNVQVQKHYKVVHQDQIVQLVLDMFQQKVLVYGILHHQHVMYYLHVLN